MKKINEIYECSYDTIIKDIKINSKEIIILDHKIITKGKDHLIEMLDLGIDEIDQTLKIDRLKIQDTK